MPQSKIEVEGEFVGNIARASGSLIAEHWKAGRVEGGVVVEKRCRE